MLTAIPSEAHLFFGKSLFIDLPEQTIRMASLLHKFFAELGAVPSLYSDLRLTFRMVAIGAFPMGDPWLYLVCSLP